MHTDIPEGTDRSPLGPLAEGVLRRETARWWWVPLAAGVAWFVIAWLVLRANYTSLATVGVLVGVVFLIAAVNEAVLAGFMTGGWKAAHYILAVLFVAGALWAFIRPVETFFALASVLGLILFLQGALYIALGIGLRDVSPYWALQLLSGFLLTALGVWVSVSDRVWDLRARAVFVLLWVGLMALFRGISDIVLAFSMLWSAKRGDRREPDRAAVGTPARIPAQGGGTSTDAPRPETPSAPRP
jgi:uncharacterized membrane protein HdeD (DUF308 family)